MEKLFIPAKSTIEINLSNDIKAKFEKLGKVGVATTVQHEEQVKEIVGKLPNAKFIGKVLGCNIFKPIMGIDAVVFIGTGSCTA